MTKQHYEYGFGVNKTLVEKIKEGAFERTFFKDIYSGVNGKWDWSKILLLKVLWYWC